LRRGSSTAVGSPEEIAQMGAERAATPNAEPTLELAFYDRTSGAPAGNHVSLRTMRLDTPQKKDIPPYDGGGTFYSGLGINGAYYRDLTEYTRITHSVAPVAFTLHNAGEVSAQDVRLSFEVDDPENACTFMEQWDMPEPAQRERTISLPGPTIHDRHDVIVERAGTKWRVECLFGKIQPHGRGRLDNVLYVGAGRSCSLTVEGQLSADNLSRPQPVRFDFEFAVERKAVSLDDIETMERRRFFATPEGAAMLDDIGREEEE
jgi:hypothetical protein